MELFSDALVPSKSYYFIFSLFCALEPISEGHEVVFSFIFVHILILRTLVRPNK